MEWSIAVSVINAYGVDMTGFVQPTEQLQMELPSPKLTRAICDFAFPDQVANKKR